MRLCAWLCAAALLLVAATQSSFVTDAYVQASIDPAGQLQIVTRKGRKIVPQKDTEQVGFERPAISQDGRAVGWLALYPAGFTSYPIPRKLVVLAGGRARAFTGSGLAVWRWSFQGGGKRVAFYQATTHGYGSIHYELRDIATGRLLAEHSPPYDRDNRLLPDPDPPAWVAELNAKK